MSMILSSWAPLNSYLAAYRLADYSSYRQGHGIVLINGCSQVDGKMVSDLIQRFTNPDGKRFLLGIFPAGCSKLPSWKSAYKQKEMDLQVNFIYFFESI